MLMGSLYVIQSEVGIKSAFLKYRDVLLGKNISKPEIEKEAQFLRNTLDEYYKIDPNSSLSSKVQILTKNFDARLVSKHQIKLQSGLSHFYENDGSQNYQIEKISYDKESGSYFVNLNVKQIVKNEKPYDFDVELNIKVKKTDLSNFMISYWDETILSVPFKITAKYQLNQASPLSIAFPCRVVNLSSKDKNSKIEYKVLSDYTTVIFNTNDDTFEETGFLVNCEKSKFEVSLESNDTNSVIFAALNDSNGKTIQRDLTPQEKMNLSIRKQLRLWGLVEEK